MKGRTIPALFFLLLFAGSSAAQTVDAGYEVGTWRGFRPAAVTFTFDDNDRNQLAVAVPMFDAFDFKLTLFALTSTDWRPIDWDGLAAAAARGMRSRATPSATPGWINCPPSSRRTS